ncbi:hypothetical protein CsSME_00024074 [Camellia sinensis var. sinensis]
METINSKKWGLSSIVDCRSEFSVAGGRSRKEKSQEEVVGNDEVVQFLSFQKEVGVDVSGTHGHWDSVSAITESSSKHALQLEACDHEGRRILNLRSISRSIGPQPGLNLEVVLGEPTFVGPYLGKRCTVIDIEEVDQNLGVEPLNIGENLKVGVIEDASVGSVEEDISRSTFGAKITINLQTKSKLRGARIRFQQRSRNQLTTTKKGASLKDVIAAFSLASSSKLGSSSGRIILNETQATEDVVLNRIADLERQDVASIEQRRHQQIREVKRRKIRTVLKDEKVDMVPNIVRSVWPFDRFEFLEVGANGFAGGSSHCFPILGALGEDSRDWGPKLFRFMNCWFFHFGFLPMVAKVWLVSIFGNLTSQLKLAEEEFYQLDLLAENPDKTRLSKVIKIQGISILWLNVGRTLISLTQW